MASDRLNVPTKIDSRHPDADRRDPGLTPWAIKGELILNCNCTVFCPCVVSLGKHAPKGRVRAFGRVWDFDGRSAEICQIDWHGPK